MIVVLVAAAAVGLALAGSGYWALWQSRTASADIDMPPALVTFPERRPLAEFILVDDEKGVFDLKSLEASGRLFSLASCTALTSALPLYDRRRSARNDCSGCDRARHSIRVHFS